MSQSYQDKLRKELRARAILDGLFQIRDALASGFEILYPKEGRDPIERPLTKERAGHLIAAANIDLRMLNKLLPDQKAVEVTDARGPALTHEERAARLLHILNHTNTPNGDGPAATSAQALLSALSPPGDGRPTTEKHH